MNWCCSLDKKSYGDYKPRAFLLKSVVDCCGGGIDDCRTYATTVMLEDATVDLTWIQLKTHPFAATVLLCHATVTFPHVTKD